MLELTVAPYFALYSVSLSPGAKIKPQISGIEQIKMWRFCGLERTQHNGHLLQQLLMQLLSAKWRRGFLQILHMKRTPTRTQTEAWLAEQREREGKEEGRERSDERENILSIKEYVTLILIISWGLQHGIRDLVPTKFSNIVRHNFGN